MRVKGYTEYLVEARSPKPADVIVKSLEGSEAAAGLRALGARVKSVGQHRVVITGIPDRVVETPEHPDNPRSMWRSYRKSPSRFDSNYSDEFFMNLEGLWKTMWANVIKNLSDLRVPGKRNLDTVAELEKQGVDHTSGLDVEALMKELVDENNMPNAGRIREGLQSLENGGWSFEIIPKVNHLTVNAFPPEESIRRAFNVPIKGVEIRGRIAPKAAYFYLTVKKQPSRRSYYNQLHGNEEEIVAGMRRVLDGRIQTSLELDFERYLVNGIDVVGVMRNPFEEYVRQMTQFLKTIPIEAYRTSDAKIIEEAKRLFRSEGGSVLLAFLDERYGLEPKAGGMDRYRKSIVEEYERDPSMVQGLYDSLDEAKRRSVFGPDLIALFKSKSLFL